MSGSGARVNAGTMRVILESQQQHGGAPGHSQASVHCGAPDGDYDCLDAHSPDDSPDECLPFDLDWDPPEPAENATLTPLAPVSGLDALDALDAVAPVEDYATMPAGSIVNTVLFSTKSPLLRAQYSQECCDLLEHAFAVPTNSIASDLPLLILDIVSACNFEVTEITRLQHKALYDMHSQFKQSYTIRHTRRVYHGTAQALTIARVGFRGAASNRAKFGKGIYSSTGVFQALAYSELTPELTLTFIVAQLHLGPMGLGKKDQVDFGRDPSGQQIFTLTNIEGDIFCASHEAQLLPTHIVTVRYQSENPHTDSHLARVGMYNAALWDRIKARSQDLPDRQLPPPAPPQAQAPQDQAQALALQARAQAFWAAKAQAQASLRWKDAEHSFHKIGSAVKISRVNHQKFNAYLNFEGVIRRIMARGTDFLFFVQIQRNALGDVVDSDSEITLLNRRCFYFLHQDERGLLPCKNMHMSRPCHLQPPPKDDDDDGENHTAAKKPRLGGSDGAASV